MTASAPGKVIITGEHFVVHGSYAVAAAINRRARVTVSQFDGIDSEIISDGYRSKVSYDDNMLVAAKSVVRRAFQEYGTPNKNNKLRIEISSEIPAGSGLGSSAAISVATAAAVASFLGQERDPSKISEIAMFGEKSVHGNPSGIDIETSLRGGMLLFNKKNGSKPIPLDRVIQLLVVFSGKPRSTSKLISEVSEKKKLFPGYFERLVQAASFVSLDVAEAASKGDLPHLGALMNLAQASLSWIGVSTAELENMIEAVLVGDVFGAKLTGAGGGGSIIALPSPEKAETLLREVSRIYKHSFITSIPQEGLRWEN